MNEYEYFDVIYENFYLSQLSSVRTGSVRSMWQGTPHFMVSEQFFLGLGGKGLASILVHCAQLCELLCLFVLGYCLLCVVVGLHHTLS